MLPSVLAGARDVAKFRFTEDGSPAGGQSILVRDGEAGTISAHLNATHLDPNHAYTYWWAVFNNPDACSDGVCGEDDIFIDHGPPPVLNMDQINAVGIAVLGGNGEVVNNGGHATFTGTLFEGSALGHDVVLGPGGIVEAPHLLEDATEAEVHIILKNHGPAQSGADLAEQVHTFWGNCTTFPVVDDDPQFACAEEQIAVHKPDTRGR